MLRSNRKDYPSKITPKGVAIWPALNEPDYKFKEGGEWHAKIALDPDAPGLAEIITHAEELRDAAYDAAVEELTRQGKKGLIKKLEKMPILRDEEDDDGEPTGRVLLRASLPFRVESKKTGKSYEFKPDLFDARGKKLKNPPKIGGGSEMKLSVRPVDYETKDTKTGGRMFGTSFELQAAQIIKLVSFGSRNADDYGFGEEDGDAIEDQDSGFTDEGGGYESDDDGDNADF